MTGAGRDSAVDPVVLALTGQLPFVIMAAAVAAYPVSLALLVLYRRAVLAQMAKGAAHSRPAAPAGRGDRERAGGCEAMICAVAELGTAGDDGAAAPVLYRLARRRMARLGLAYALGGAAFGLVMVTALLLAAGMEFLPVRVAFLFWLYAWPAAIA